MTERPSFQDLINKALNLLVFVDLNNPVIVFKCDQKFVNDRLGLFIDDEDDGSSKSRINPERDSFLKMMRDVEPYHKKPTTKNDPPQVTYSQDIIDYTDTLTAWIFEWINSASKKVEFELIEIEKEGLCIRYSPIDHVNIHETSLDDFRDLNESLKEIIVSLRSQI